MESAQSLNQISYIIMIVLGRPRVLVKLVSWSFPAMNYWVEVVQGGRMACDVRTSIGDVVIGEMMRLVAWCIHGCFGC